MSPSSLHSEFHHKKKHLGCQHCVRVCVLQHCDYFPGILVRLWLPLKWMLSRCWVKMKHYCAGWWNESLSKVLKASTGDTKQLEKFIVLCCSCESPTQLCCIWLGSYIPWKCQTEFLIFFYFYGIHNLVFTSLFSARKATGFAWTCAKKQHSIIRAGKCELCLLLLREYLVGQWKFKCPVDCFICICREKLVQQMNNAKLFFFFQFSIMLPTMLFSASEYNYN